MGEFSFRTRARALERFREETFDILVIGGGITGAAVARDAASRGLSVAVVEKNDFAYGTSSRSSKLIHGGLRYLQNMEFGLVFEALAERAFLMRTVPHLVKPLPFYLPVFGGDKNGRVILGMGLWLYDLLALFRTPSFHKSLSRKKFLEEIPFLKADGLRGGFRYYDASMWDDVLAVETLRAASDMGAAVVNYVEALRPIWEGDRIQGFELRDHIGDSDLSVRAKQVIVCAGPWTDEVGARLSPDWRNWLKPSKGVHLILDLKRIPVPGAVVMAHPEDGRIAFVIPRPDFGAGVVIVGTTDGPTPARPEDASVEQADIEYLMGLLQKYFPDLKLSKDDIVSAYVGVRPLFGDIPKLASTGAKPSLVSDGAPAPEEASHASAELQKVSREHHIGPGPGGSVVVAGGKYTTHRRMGKEIVDFALKNWKKAYRAGHAPALPEKIGPSRTEVPVNPDATFAAVATAREQARVEGLEVPEQLFQRYGAAAVGIYKDCAGAVSAGDPEGFPCLEAQLRYALRFEMVLKLEDFYFRRVPLFASRKDHGLPWAERLAGIMTGETKANQDARKLICLVEDLAASR